MSKYDPIGAPAQDGARRSRRSELKVEAKIVRSGKLMRIALRDLSAGGASAVTAFPPGPGEQVHFSCNGTAVNCRVAWARGNTFGLAFDQPLTTAQLRALNQPKSQE